jgi:hypothetical protein
LTSKLRQFDLRAVRKVVHGCIHLAIECKQLRPNYPLLVLRVPRPAQESFHELLLVVDPERCPIGEAPDLPAYEKKAVNISIRGSASLYPQDDPVGKACAQVGRDHSGITGSDAEMFGKWTQAISSAQGMIDGACTNTPADREGWLVTLVLPVVVVPDDRLWVVDYNPDGTPTGPPTQVTRCSYLLSTTCRGGDNLSGSNYTLSHLEFVTLRGLEELIDILGNDDGPNDRYFPSRQILSHFRR